MLLSLAAEIASESIDQRKITPVSFGLLNFKESSYLNDQGKRQPMFEMTRAGFSVLAMGFTGKRAPSL